MSDLEIIRAWKDPGYRARLSEGTLGTLPAHPAGTIELPEPTLQPVSASKGFRLRSGLRAGHMCGSEQANCSAYGDNLWNSELTLN